MLLYFVLVLEHERTFSQPQPLCNCGLWDSYKILAMHLPEPNTMYLVVLWAECIVTPLITMNASATSGIVAGVLCM